jgi:hypothetical protein
MRNLKLGRKSAGRNPKPKVWIFTEGQVSEPAYIFALYKELNCRSFVIDVDKNHGVPETLLDLAKSKVHEIKKAKKKQLIGCEDEVWVVFDRDTHPNVLKVLNEANELGISVCYSNPCFEFWLILHEEECDRPCTVRELKSDLAAKVDAYCSKKKVIRNASHIVGKYEIAVERAIRSCANRKEEGDEQGNPSTTVYTLVQRFSDGT